MSSYQYLLPIGRKSGISAVGHTRFLCSSLLIRTVAENNAKLYRNVFRCMPDNEVKTWKEYKEYVAYAERFAQAHGGGKSRDGVNKTVPTASGPPGQGTTADRLRMLGPLGEKAGDAEEKSESLAEKIKSSLPLKDNNNNNANKDRSLSKVEEWAEAANREQAERQQKHISGDTITDEKAALDAEAAKPSATTITTQQQQQTEPHLKEFTPLKPSTTFDSAAMEKSITPPSININQQQQQAHPKRRRRATTKSSRREFHATDDLMEKDTAEELMSMVQGHLVVWPYDWLVREEQGGNWLYSIDGLAPLEI